MRKLIILVFFLTSCSASAVQDNSNFVAQKKDDSNVALNEDVVSRIWRININDSQARAAQISAIGKTPDGETQTIFWLQCPAEKNNLVSINYLVQNSSKISNFNFDDFEGPDAPVQNKKLVEIRATSSHETLSFRTAVAGSYGAVEDLPAFVFELGTIKQDKIMQLAQMVAKGSTKITFVVHDNRDYQKTVETTFPAIDAAGDVAKTLNGCRK